MIDIGIVDIIGRVIRKYDAIAGNVGSNVVTISTMGISAGVYWIEIQHQETIEQVELIIQ